MIKSIILTIFTLFASLSLAQKIQILDKNTNQPIPFASVRSMDGKHGLSSDIDGYVNLNSDYKSLIISHINYQSQPFNAPFSTKIYLVPKQNELFEVVVSSVNPAIRIIKKAVENRDLNNPRNLNSFSHYAYSRLYLDMNFSDSTTAKKMKNQHVFMSESRTKHDFLKPNREQETLLAHKTSGVKNPLFASALTDFQPFTFYDELINLKIMRKTYLNPISKNAWKKYDFDLTDTLINDTDSTFVIAFEPKPNSTFEGFKGFLHINSDGYALENLSVEPVTVGSMIHFKMQQRYERVGKIWFPKQQNTEIGVANISGKNTMAKYIHKMYLSDIEINNIIKNEDFSAISRKIEPKSYVAEDTFWNKYRSDSLSSKEINTYQFYESLPVKRLNQIDKFFNVAEYLLSGFIPFHQFKIPTEALYRQNIYEGIRMGFGLRTGDSFSKKLAFEASAGYGFKDKALKYRFLGQFNLNNPRAFFQISYRQDLVEPATIDEGNQNLNISDLSFRNWLTSRMDSVQQTKLSFQTPFSRNGILRIGVLKELRNPTYPYQFTTNESPSNDYTFRNTSVSVGLRWAWGEKYSQLNNTVYQSEKPRAILQIYAEKAMKGILDSDFDFTKLNISFQQRFESKHFGRTDYKLTATKIWGDVPYSYLSNGLGSSDRLGSLKIQNLFQTMGLYEFMSDQQVTLFVKQNFGRFIPSQKTYFQPEFSLSQGISYGSLQNPNFHKNIDFKTLENGYFESGAMIDKLLRIKYIDVFYLEFGVGVFARYGAYALPNAKDNYALRWNFNVSF